MISPLHQAAQTWPEAIAVKLPRQGGALSAQDVERLDCNISYRQLSQEVKRLAKALLAQGLNKGERLACIGHNSLSLITLYWACIDAKLVFFPISPRFPMAQVQTLLTQYQVRHYWADPQAGLLTLDAKPISLGITAADKPASLAPMRATERELLQALPVSLILTSGSSGQPKAALHSLNNHVSSARAANQIISVQAGDAWLLSLPLFHIGGLAILHRCALTAACVVLVDTELSLSRQIKQDRLTHVSLVSAQLHELLLQLDRDLSSIKALLLGGGAVSDSLMSQLIAEHIPSYLSYGMTEMSSQITTARLAPRGIAALGQPLGDNEIKLVDDIVWVRGPSLFLGYLEAHSLKLILPTDSEAWFCTQDKGRLDAQGRLSILGRMDNMFICGGENVHPEEIEAALKNHPEIDDALVFAIDDEKFGQLPAAVIRCHGALLADGDAGEDGNVNSQRHQILDAFLATRLARFKCPRRYYLWPNMSTISLKVPRKQIIARVLSQEV